MATISDLSMISGTYAGSTFSDSYKIDQLIYPDNLQSDEYGGNKVVFYINVAEDSKFLKPSDATYKNLDDLGITRLRGTGIEYGFDSVDKAGWSAITPFAIEAGAALGALVKDSLFGSGIRTIGKAAAIGIGAGAAIGIGVAKVGYEALDIFASSATRKQKRLKAAIALHIPNNLQIKYSTNWESEDTATGFMAASAGEALSKAFDTGSMKLPTEDKNHPIAAIISNIALSKGPNAGMMSSLTGLAANPRKEQVFKGVDFRTFSFDYQFFPRSHDESVKVENIIKMFKFHMHPEIKDIDSFIYLYPSEFDIIYYKGVEENSHLHRHTSCVLVDMSVNYTPNGNFNTFENGMPTQINIMLTFKELALMNKSLIANGL